jgi:phospholipid/cholesterol/gamma-HCH transport system substrate-binding protein
METRASYVIVGGFVLALIVGLFLFVVWLAKVQVSHEFSTYRIYFKGAVTGLQEGGVVRYRGIAVGSVKQVRIDPENVEEIEVTIEVNSNTPVREDTEASTEIQGLTGVAYIQLSGGTQSSPPLLPKAGKRYAVIKSRPSQLEKVFSSAPQLLDRVNLLVERATIMFNDRNLQAFADTLDNIKMLTAAFAAKSGQIQATIDDGSAAMRELRKTAASLDGLVKNLQGNADATLGSVKKLAENTDNHVSAISAQLVPTVTRLRQTAEALNRLSGELEKVVAENRRPLRDFSSQGLYELTQFLSEARGMVASLTRLTDKIQADPARFFFGDQQQGVKTR